MNCLLVLLLLCHYFVENGTAEHEKYRRTIHGYEDPPNNGKKTFIIERNFENGGHNLEKRSIVTTDDSKIIQKINYLNDTHKQLMVHWVGEGSNVIICLARHSSLETLAGDVKVGPSAVYISYDYGDTYMNKTDLFKLSDGSYATLEKFYNHPKYNTHFVFADVNHKVLYVTANHGRDIKRIDLDFTPSDVSFHELQPSVFVVLDKVDSVHKLWVTEDFGNSFRATQDFVKATYWIKENDFRHTLLVQRMEPSGYNAILSSSDLFSNRTVMVQATGIKDFYVKGDYLFTTKLSSKGVLELYVSYKLGKKIKCVFDTALEIRSYFIVDVTSNRALVAVSHADTVSHLYVSENLDNSDGIVKFTLSLEDVLCYFPNSTWHDTWIHHVSEEAFADVYKVEGLSGIYIASHVLTKPQGNNLGPQHLGSVITFDHGRSWRLIQAPFRDVEGQPTSCSVQQNCSLHLSQKFSQLYPDTRSISILSSKSAPGLIIATGVLGKSLKGHYGVYISSDAGQTWRQTLRDLYFFNMGDHGGILTAVKYFKLRGETRHVLYSTDEGETWKQAAFHDQNIRLYGLMTEPGENTTVFTMFGSLPEEHQWIIIKLDLIKAFAYNCSKDDYKPWSPSQSDENRSYIPCVMGQQITYHRRMPHANCYNGENFDVPISMTPCGCDIYDYECDFGFVRSEKPGNCIRNTSIVNDPYQVPPNCKPGKFYKRTKGYRKIQGDVCVDGFENHYMPEEIPCPFNEVDDFLLFAQREKISRLNLVTKKLEELPVRNLKNVIAIDFDMRNNCVYWADIALDTIGRQCLNDSEPEILVSSDLASIEGMALDWISNTLYFVDGIRSKIELIRTDVNHSGRMRRTVLKGDVLKKPRGIALHPKAGYMFWTDWSVERPSVNRADLDGSNVVKLFGKPRVEWPNGITIDYIAERIYWVDARQDYIASSDLHGDFLKIIISRNDVVSHPFAVAVFKNTMYWDDWKRNAIFSADKDTYHGVEVLQKQLPGLMDLKVYAHGVQVGTNACTVSKCSYICVGKPKKNFSCLCPDGMEYNNGRCLCPGHVPPLANFTCPPVQNTCSSNHFTCRNGLCVPKGWKCDGEDDCGDSSDEAHCGLQSCPPNYFVCGDGKCLPQYWKCDYDYDCSDGSDELDCPKQNCTDGQFTCKNGRCIAEKWKCDGENDCRDGSDELNCEPVEPHVCKSEEFQCKTGGVKCIPTTWQCDGEKDCRDGSDETNCKNNTCLDIQFSCGEPSNRCIYKTWVCDGDKDCPNGSDEVNCTTPAISVTIDPDQFIPKNGTCQDWMFRCQNQRCIPYWWKCDQADDCGDGSDELGCFPSHASTSKPTTTSPGPLCGNNQFECMGGTCIFSSWVCDGMEDCVGGEDERHCEGVRNCTKDEFKCHVDGSCIPLSAVCNLFPDCPDLTDESLCDHNLPSGPATPSCSKGYFPCDGGSCYPLAALCDGRVDCRDGYDESNCSTTSRVYQVLHMGVDERSINETSLLLYWWITDPPVGKLEFLPSISKVGENLWENKTWMNDTEYKFTNLQPATQYNMTIYVRIQNTTKVFLPAKYFIAYTAESVPSPPWNVTAVQTNGSHVLLSWNKPTHPNGQIINYEIGWYPPRPPIKLKLNGNETAHLLSAYFEPNREYNFYVIAHNKKYESKQSKVTKLKFDGDAKLHEIQNVKVDKKTENSVTLSWKYNKTVEGYTVAIIPPNDYPRMLSRVTKTKSITVDKLAPGTRYTFKINAYKNAFTGPEVDIIVITDGVMLPEVPSLQGKLVKEVGTSVKLSWGVPKDSRKVTWTYGVYYGIDADELYEKSRYETTDLTTTISDLKACEFYTFKVGVVGPYGQGPLSKSLQINTFMNKKAPPKKLTVKEVDYNPMKMLITWLPSCPTIAEPIGHIIRVYERTTGVDSLYGKPPGNYSHVLNVKYGAIYDISVATREIGAIYTPNVTYYAPPILPPHEVKTSIAPNGSFIVEWQEADVPKDVGPYKYEVLVSEGNTMDEATARRFRVDKPPFIYSNSSSNMFTFAVQIVTDSGYKSITSEKLSATVLEAPTTMGGTNLWLILVLTILSILVVLTLGLFIVKHRRLQNSFTRFANSHYDTRSGAATFDDNGLEEEESPQITGFSDDEPLVIA
ncbi:sortilin-related receptor-like isoform X1 [Tribolium madens]|uniref:sortilin-related receptor-like isoform X1 n=2 Tax=Tribolium madens TaxID=41895 RepID=UPI001CF750F7|nr:sortilin-related receptor-like isoform X1 [Tribolium madens]